MSKWVRYITDEAGEIAALSEKTAPVDGDELLLEDSEDLEDGKPKKKRVSMANLPSGATSIDDLDAFTGTQLNDKLSNENASFEGHTHPVEELESMTGTQLNDLVSNETVSFEGHTHDLAEIPRGTVTVDVGGILSDTLIVQGTNVTGQLIDYTGVDWPTVIVTLNGATLTSGPDNTFDTYPSAVAGEITAGSFYMTHDMAAGDIIQVFVPGGTLVVGTLTDHALTTGKQGGQAGEYYHLTQTEAQSVPTSAAHAAVIAGNPHSVTAPEIGLGSVDNTSDANKPVSGPQQAALDLKLNIADAPSGGAAPLGLGVWTAVAGGGVPSAGEFTDNGSASFASTTSINIHTVSPGEGAPNEDIFLGMKPGDWLCFEQVSDPAANVVWYQYTSTGSDFGGGNRVITLDNTDYTAVGTQWQYGEDYRVTHVSAGVSVPIYGHDEDASTDRTQAYGNISAFTTDLTAGAGTYLINWSCTITGTSAGAKASFAFTLGTTLIPETESHQTITDAETTIGDGNGSFHNVSLTHIHTLGNGVGLRVRGMVSAGTIRFANSKFTAVKL